MKDSRFIELLNLYVDHQISPEEAGELEMEILRTPERRRIYRNYCSMQRACALLGERERSLVPESPMLARALAEADSKIIAFPQNHRSDHRRTVAATFGGLAAMAACVALVMTRIETASNQAPASGPAFAVISGNTANPDSVPAQIAAVELPAKASVYQPVFVAQTLGREGSESDGTEKQAPEWMRRIELSPVQQQALADDLSFETRPNFQPDNRVFRGRYPVQGNAEFTAFQFQR